MSDRAPLYKYKGNRCAACGLAVEEMIARHGTFNRMFQFHHIDPDSKDRHYKRLMSQRLTRRQMDEIDKCVLLCTQCHATMHAQEITGTLRLSVQLNKRLVSQSLKGWVKADFVDRRLAFVTNEPYLLHPCEIRIGSEAPKSLCLIEIEEDSNLHDWLRKIEHHKHIEIYSFRDRKVVMQLDHVEGKRIAVKQAIGFPLTRLELHATNVPGEKIYFRNGIVLMASGAIHSTGVISYELSLH